LATLWLALSVPLGLLLRPTIHDFGQFYVGGLLVRHGDWTSLYPIPARRSLDNAGMRTHSFAKPGWLSFSASRQVPDYTHFILPPPSALIFVPFSYLTYRQAFWAWMLLSTCSLLGVAVLSARIHRIISGDPSRWEGVLLLLIVLSPMSARAIRIGNVSTQIALMIAATFLALLRAEPKRTAGAMLAGALLKYATWVMGPVLLAMRRWSTIAWLALFTAGTVGLTLHFSGVDPFIEFGKVILPTLSRPSAYAGNQSLPGMLARLYGRPLPLGVSTLLDMTRVLTLGIIALLLARLKPAHFRQPVTVIASSALLLSWLLVFSPIAWEHWPVMLCPAWGWLLWEWRQKTDLRWCAPTALVLMYFPAGIFQVRGIAAYPLRLPEPFNSFQLGGMALVALVALARLAAVLSSKPAAAEVSSEPGQLIEIKHQRKRQGQTRVARIAEAGGSRDAARRQVGQADSQ
jgi:hypothetical protein